MRKWNQCRFAKSLACLSFLNDDINHGSTNKECDMTCLQMHVQQQCRNQGVAFPTLLGQRLKHALRAGLAVTLAVGTVAFAAALTLSFAHTPAAVEPIVVELPRVVIEAIREAAPPTGAQPEPF
jgi:hypothetical protein